MSHKDVSLLLRRENLLSNKQEAQNASQIGESHEGKHIKLEPFI
jgi:hypothetical protein